MTRWVSESLTGQEPRAITALSEVPAGQVPRLSQSPGLCHPSKTRGGLQLRSSAQSHGSGSSETTARSSNFSSASTNQRWVVTTMGSHHAGNHSDPQWPRGSSTAQCPNLGGRPGGSSWRGRRGVLLLLDCIYGWRSRCCQKGREGSPG